MKAILSRLLLSPILLIGCLSVLPGTTPRAEGGCSDPIYVDASATGTGSGTSWANAMTSLQDGLAAAVTCASTEVWVGAGTYKPDQGVAQTRGDRFATFQLIDGVAIYGGFPPGGGDGTFGARDILANETILSGDLVGNDTPLACGDDSPDCDLNGGLCADGFCIVAQNNSENCYHVVTGSGTNATAVLDGCTITGGNADSDTHPTNKGGGMSTENGSPMIVGCTFSGNYADLGGGMHNRWDSNPTVTDCTFSGNAGRLRGGGMDNNQSNPTVTYCTFSRNAADFGGGMFNDGGSSPTVTNCTFSENTTDNAGGGMYNNNSSSPTVTNCTFSGNSTTFGGGGMHISAHGSSVPTVTNCKFLGNTAVEDGGGVNIVFTADDSGNLSLTNCTFSGNTAGRVGGGMKNTYNGSPTLTNCTFSGNTAVQGGGGMHSIYTSPSLTNVTFSGNTANDGGAMFNALSSPTLTNVTVSGNSAGNQGGGVYSIESNPTVTNCIIWSNSDAGGTDESAQIHTDSGTPVVNYCIVQGGWNGAGGMGNSSSDPLFIDADGDDDIVGTEDDNLRLAPDSPGIDAADNTAVPPDTADLDGDGDTSERTPLDLDGNPRFADDPDIIDTGVPDPPDYVAVVNMGAYEFGCSDDGDGIAANIDGRMIAGAFVSDACIFSDNFTDEALAGTTFGRIVNRDGLTVEVTDAPDAADGVRITVSGTDPAAQARIRVCSGPETDFHNLNIGDEIIVTCGSASVQVVSGPVTATFDTIEAELPTETAVTVTEIEPGTFDVSSSPESAAPIIVGGLVIEPGETATVSDTDGDGEVDEVDPCPLDNPDDTDGDGVCDSADLCLGDDASGDTDGDGVCEDIDNCQLFNPDQVDCQPNGVGDVCDIADGAADQNGNGVPDECEGPMCGDCPTDVDGSGNTGASDLAVLLGSWGPCAPGDSCECLDPNEDGIIGAFDLAQLLGAWGPCP